MVLIGGYEDSLKRLGVQSWQSSDGAAPSYHFDMLQASAPRLRPSPPLALRGLRSCWPRVCDEEGWVTDGGGDCRTRSGMRLTGGGSRRRSRRTIWSSTLARAAASWR